MLVSADFTEFNLSGSIFFETKPFKINQLCPKSRFARVSVGLLSVS
jgi:hypothetical protein